ncbi:MAG: hypothetical protein HKN87_13980 [Saprospiraceae bacterium]|nr:hypothetical protein [Saprospiraceae bacterium]
MIGLLQIQNPITSPGTGSFTTHSIEILLICLGMFLLGWFMHQLIYGQKRMNMINELEKQLRSTKSRITNLEGDLESCNAAIVKVKGENAAMGAQLSRFEREGSRPVLDHGLEFPDISSPEEVVAETTPQIDDLLIASLAADIAGAGMIAFDAQTAEGVFGKPVREDDLQLIEGIGPLTAELLQNHSIHTWRQLGSTSVPQIQSILEQGGEKFGSLNPSSWPKQARMAADGEWTKLREYLDFLHGGNSDELGSNPDHGQIGEESGSDDLTKIAGIGRKVQMLLYGQSINRWSTLANTDVNHLREILHAAGERFRSHDPATWPKQAQLAAAGRWDELQNYQDSLNLDR